MSIWSRCWLFFSSLFLTLLSRSESCIIMVFFQLSDFNLNVCCLLTFYVLHELCDILIYLFLLQKQKIYVGSDSTTTFRFVQLIRSTSTQGTTCFIILWWFNFILIYDDICFVVHQWCWFYFIDCNFFD